jgi:hypothetical protein
VVWVAPLKRHDVPILPVLPFPGGEDCDSCKALPTHPPARPPAHLLALEPPHKAHGQQHAPARSSGRGHERRGW